MADKEVNFIAHSMVSKIQTRWNWTELNWTELTWIELWNRVDWIVDTCCHMWNSAHTGCLL
jgi:hypothetical protein